MKVAILQANLNNFDTPIDPVKQSVPSVFHRWTDENFPPIMGLTPRLQYRIPKTHGWQMKPGYDFYVWLDGGWTFSKENCLEWYLKELGECDMAFFKHPNRNTINEEVEHIEDHLELGKPYISARYVNGLHREQLNEIEDTGYKDRRLFASTMFIYRNTPKVQQMLKDWWYEGTRYFTCDQVVLPFLIYKHDIRVKTLSKHIYKNPYLTQAGNHK